MEHRFIDKKKFMAKLKELCDSGHSPDKLEIYLPHPDHDIEHLVEQYKTPSKLKYFTLTGGLIGCFTGFAFAVWTALDWELVTGGKPFASWPAYTIIAFELTILLGALFSFAGLFVLARLPRFSKMLTPGEYGNEFVIIIDDEEK